MKNIDLFETPQTVLISGLKKLEPGLWEVTKMNGTVIHIPYSGDRKSLMEFYNLEFPKCNPNKGA